MRTLSVSSGTRLSSSTYSSGAIAHRRDERAVDEDVGVVALGEHTGRVEVADEAGRGQLGVALDELEADAELVGDGPQQRRLAGAGRALDEDVAPGVEGGQHELELALAPDEATLQVGERRAGAADRDQS